jgi:hypothetical protein
MEILENAIDTLILKDAGEGILPLVGEMILEGWKKADFWGYPVRIDPDHVMAVAHASCSPFEVKLLRPVQQVRGRFGKKRYLVTEGNKEVFAKQYIEKCELLLPDGTWALYDAAEWKYDHKHDFLAVRSYGEWVLFLAPGSHRWWHHK